MPLGAASHTVSPWNQGSKFCYASLRSLRSTDSPAGDPALLLNNSKSIISFTKVFCFLLTKGNYLRTAQRWLLLSEVALSFLFIYLFFFSSQTVLQSLIEPDSEDKKSRATQGQIRVKWKAPNLRKKITAGQRKDQDSLCFSLAWREHLTSKSFPRL